MFGRGFGMFGVGYLLMQPCPICGHSSHLHIGKDWRCMDCGCTGFSDISVDSIAACICGHAKETHYHGEGLCEECPCLEWESNEN